MTTMTAHEHEHGHEEHHIHPIGLYVIIWAALVVLTAITVIVAQFDFGAWNTVVALLVATIKGSLVALYFMHLRWDNKFNLIILLGSLMLVFIFFYPTLTDLTTRGTIDPLRNEEIGLPQPPAAPPAAPPAPTH
jgi:cytochrome c oxidase subunit 4